MDFYTITIIAQSAVNLILGGGWFINYKLKKRSEKANTEISELKAKEANLEYYVKRIIDLEARLLNAEKTIEILSEKLKNK